MSNKDPGAHFLAASIPKRHRPASRELHIHLLKNPNYIAALPSWLQALVKAGTAKASGLG
jgi:hypothetical protein